MARIRFHALVAIALSTALLTACTGGPPRFGFQRAALSDAGTGSDAEALFAEGYRLEQRAVFGQATQYYTLVIDRFPASPLAEIARTRMAGLSAHQPAIAAAAAPGEPAALAPGDFACTIEGLYPNRARWCGQVRQVRNPYLLIEVSDLRFNSWLAFWFTASTCTGDRTLTWFSQGDQVWIPRTCLAEPGRV